MLERHEEVFINPLDNVEEVLTYNNWVYNRTNDDELIVTIAGRNCTYRLLFIWQEGLNALQYVCQYDITVSEKNRSVAYEAIANMNAMLWMGHLEVTADTLIPSFRHTALLPHHAEYHDRIEDLVDISLAQCERFQPVFQILSDHTQIDMQTLSLAMMDISGES